MSYDPTQQVPPPQGYPPNYGAAQQPTYAQPPGQQGYTPPPPSVAPPPYTPPAPATYAQYSSIAPAPVGASSGFNLFWRNLGLTGQAAGLGGILCFLFFLFPWISGTTSYNGFSTASSSDSTVNLFPYVWLIFLGMLGLIAMTWPLSQRRWFSRQTATVAVIATSAVMLALEFCYLLEINSFTRDTSAGTGAGFWLDLITTFAVLCVASYGLLQERKAAQLLAANPYQAAQYPGSQPSPYTPPQYPGSQPPHYPAQ